MGRFIDPDESQYYQAIIWLSEKPAPCFEQEAQRDQLCGARWFHAALDTLPDISECSTALVVIDDIPADELMRVPDTFHRLGGRGVLLGAVVVLDTRRASVLCGLWNEQFRAAWESCSKVPIPMIVGVDTRAEVWSVLRLFNRITYGGLLVCVDWNDLLVAVENESAYYYKSTVTGAFNDVLVELGEAIENAGPIVLAMLLEAVESAALEHFSEIVDVFAEAQENMDHALSVTAAYPYELSPFGAKICWLERMPVTAASQS